MNMNDELSQRLQWLNVPADYSNYIGFTYIITNTVTGKQYVGKKLFTHIVRKKPLKGMARIRKIVKETDWLDYWGSSNELLEDIKVYGQDRFTRAILNCYKTRWEWSYGELKELVDRNVLRDKNYYNGIIRVRLPAYKKC